MKSVSTDSFRSALLLYEKSYSPQSTDARTSHFFPCAGVDSRHTKQQNEELMLVKVLPFPCMPHFLFSTHRSHGMFRPEHSFLSTISPSVAAWSVKTNSPRSNCKDLPAGSFHVPVSTNGTGSVSGDMYNMAGNAHAIASSWYSSCVHGGQRLAEQLIHVEMQCTAL